MENLPRLLVISEVAVELTSAGSTLLYRLLEFYPKDKLLIFQSKQPDKDRALASVSYRQMPPPHTLVTRYSNSRFYPVASSIKYILAKRINSTVVKAIEDFKPDAIVSVTFRFAWILAQKVAEKFHLPLHLILHDDIVTAENHGYFLKFFIKKDFRKVYRFASSRFCISHNMEKKYRKEYGVGGQVIYPMLGKNDSVAPLPSETLCSRSIRFCYAGSIYTPDFPKMLDQLAMVLKEEGHSLTLFTEAHREHLKAYPNLLADHVEIREFVHPAVLRDYMMQEVDVNILLNSFQLEEPFRWNFSSKLVEYTAVGLPVFLWGPKSSGAIDWAINNKYEAVLNENSIEKLRDSIRLFKDNNKRFLLAKHMRQLGMETFGYENNYIVFINNILKRNSDQQIVNIHNAQYNF